VTGIKQGREKERDRERYMLNGVDEVLSALKQKLFRKVKVGGKEATRKQVVPFQEKVFLLQKPT
jgi:predicted HTH transcriptional regulator